MYWQYMILENPASRAVDCPNRRYGELKLPHQASAIKATTSHNKVHTKRNLKYFCPKMSVTHTYGLYMQELLVNACSWQLMRWSNHKPPQAQDVLLPGNSNT